MAQIPMLSGVVADPGADFRVSLPVNLVPVPGANGIANGYFRTLEGITRFDVGAPAISGYGRGGINWKGIEYRVIGSKFVSVSSAGAVTVIGDVGNDGKSVSMDYSFDRLAIASAGRLYYFDGGAILTLVTDPDLGAALDVTWMDGYFVTTDGEFIVVTELNDPAAVDPLKYGSSEADPDPVMGTLKLREELYAFNRYTIEVFDNIGGSNFPFQRNVGAMIEKGAVGTHAFCLMPDQVIAFLGSGRNEPCSVFIGGGGQATSVATREVEDILKTYSDTELAQAVVESRADRKHKNLIISLPRHTLTYDLGATAALQQPVWYIQSSSDDLESPMRAWHYVFCYGKWTCDDRYDQRLGVMDKDVFTQYGDDVGWRFDTTLLYNSSMGAIIHSLELVGLPGRAGFGTNPVMFLSFTKDGVTWGNERMISIGRQGERNKRMAYRPSISFENWMGIRYRGANAAIVAFTRLEAKLEPLSV